MSEDFHRCMAECGMPSTLDPFLFRQDTIKFVQVLDTQKYDQIKERRFEPMLFDTLTKSTGPSCQRFAAQIACIPLIKQTSNKCDEPDLLILDIAERQWQELIRACDPEGFYTLAHMNPSTFSVYPLVRDGKVVGLHYSMFVSRYLGLYFTSQDGKIARGVIWASPELLAPLEKALLKFMHLSDTPFYTLIAVAAALMVTIDARLIEEHRHIAKIEMRTGFHQWGKLVYLPASGKLLDLEVQLSAMQISEASSQRFLKLISDMINTMRSEILQNDQLPRTLLNLSGTEVSETLKGLERQLHNQRNVLDYTGKRVEIQHKAISNLSSGNQMKLSLQIARATRRDSSSMKILAAVTVLFLPGTFIATLFSSNMFEWQIREGATVSSQFWIYWITNVPLTLLTIGACFYWNTRMQISAEWQDNQDAMMNGVGKPIGQEADRPPAEALPAPGAGVLRGQTFFFPKGHRGADIVV